MSDEITITTDDSATQEAEQAAQRANMAAGMAMAASATQAELVGRVMEYSREDAHQEAIKAEMAANDAESAATDAVATNVAVLAQIQRFHDSIMNEMECLKQEIRDSKSSPVVVNASEPEEDVTTITPDGPKDVDEEENVSTGNKRSGKKFGRGKK